MTTYCAILHSVTGLTANLMTLRRELRMPDQLQDCPLRHLCEFLAESGLNTKERLDLAHEELHQVQLQIHQKDNEEYSQFPIDDMVWW